MDSHAPLNVLSLFDGISCARVALRRAGLQVRHYYASEIDTFAIKVSQRNYPDTIRLGDVRQIQSIPEPIDLLVGGSPCQDLSIAKKNRQGLAGDRSSLFWEYKRIRDLVRPKYFVFENVASMRPIDRETISRELGVEPIMIDAALVSAQSRKRLFWTNIPGVTLPADRGIMLRDILQDDVEPTMNMKDPMIPTTKKEQRARTKNKFIQIGYFGSTNHCKVGGQALRVYSDEGKSTTSGVGLYKTGNTIRKLTPVECERLQNLQDGYTDGISKTQRYKCLGNAFNVEVMAHMLRFLVKNEGSIQ